MTPSKDMETLLGEQSTTKELGARRMVKMGTSPLADDPSHEADEPATRKEGEELTLESRRGCHAGCLSEIGGIASCKCGTEQAILPDEADGTDTVKENGRHNLDAFDTQDDEEQDEVPQEEADLTRCLVMSEYDTDSDDMDWEEQSSEGSYDSDFDFESEATEDDD